VMYKMYNSAVHIPTSYQISFDISRSSIVTVSQTAHHPHPTHRYPTHPPHPAQP
jgi:hypothetical protein